MTKKNSMPSYRALPLSAFVLYLTMLVVFGFQSTHVHAVVLDGLLVAWTPILIITGAIFLFRTMEATGALSIIKDWLNTVSGNKIAQLMIVGWAFQFLIEGASGFGTPAAIAAPVLVGLGFPAVRVAILCLILNSVPVSFGAVGTPTWFGFSAISLMPQEILEIGYKSAVMNGIAAVFIVAIALVFLIKFRSILDNGLFILLSVFSTVLPYVYISTLSYEFPALIGGFVGLVATILLARFGIGLSKKKVQVQIQFSKNTVQLPSKESTDTTSSTVNNFVLIKAMFPLWGTVLLLVLTRIPQLGIKALLTLNDPAWSLDLGYLGVFSISPALVISLHNILNTSESWSHSLLYVPSIIPFGVIAWLSIVISSSSGASIVTIGKETMKQMRQPILALFGALVFVNLMMMGGNGSAVTRIGEHLAMLTGASWQLFAAYLGALGSFFSGSNTISNLTFAGIQDSIAIDLNLNRTTILALQSAGGAMGNMVCINNIVAVASVLALRDQEGYILKRTVIAMLVYGIVIGAVSFIF